MAAVFDSLEPSSPGVSPAERVRAARPPKVRAAPARSAWRDWLAVMGPTALVVLACATAFQSVFLGSINSLSGSGLWLVYFILVTFFFGVVLIGLAMWRFTKEGQHLARWRAAQPGSRSALLTGAHMRSLARPVYEALQGDDVDAAARQARVEREIGEFRDQLAERLTFPNFVNGALVGLGLFGTFVGLIGTLEDLGALFQGLMSTGNKDANPIDVFADMLKRLQAPMASMATAFVTSLYGLGGSLLLGLSSLMAGKVAGRLSDGLIELARATELEAARALPVLSTQAADQERLQLELRLRAEQWQAMLADVRELQHGHVRETAALRESLADVARATQGMAALMQQRMRLDHVRETLRHRPASARKAAHRHEQDLQNMLTHTRNSPQSWENVQNAISLPEEMTASLTALKLSAAQQAASLEAISSSLGHVEQLVARSVNRPMTVTFTVDPSQDDKVSPGPGRGSG